MPRNELENFERPKHTWLFEGYSSKEYEIEKEILLNTLNKKQKNLLKTLKLNVEIIPSSTRGYSVRKYLTKSQWDKIKRSVFENAKHKCEVCLGVGTKHHLECHEVWDIDESKSIQKLTAFVALCPLCHHVKHYNLNSIFNIDSERTFNTFKKRNNLTEKDARVLLKYFLGLSHLLLYKICDLDLSLLNKYDVYILKNKKFNLAKKNGPKLIGINNIIKKNTEVKKSVEIIKQRTRKINVDIISLSEIL